MKHILFSQHSSELDTAILIKESALHKENIANAYVDLSKRPHSRFVAISLYYNTKNKCPAKDAKTYLNDLLTGCKNLGIKHLIVADAAYFKFLTKIKSAATDYIGYVVSSRLDKWEEEFSVTYLPNYFEAKFNPNKANDIKTSLKAYSNYLRGTYSDPGENIIHSAKYGYTAEDAKILLNSLHKYPKLTADIESLSLNFIDCGISSISFAWDKHNGIAFAVDRSEESEEIRNLLIQFFSEYQGKLIYHNSSFDIKVLLHTLYMKDLGDYKGMVDGLHILCKNIGDAKIIAYLALNSTQRISLKLKELSLEYMGIYAEDVKDTSKIPLKDLLEYNLKDCLATWYVHSKYYPILLEDAQKDLYEGIFIPAIKSLCQMELCGIPVSPPKIKEARKKLETIVNKNSSIIMDSEIVQEFQYERLIKLAAKKTAKAKQKIYSPEDSVIARQVFNPNSDDQLRDLFYDWLSYDVIDRTKTKLPAVGAKTLKKLQANAHCEEHATLLKAFIELGKANKILTTFIPAFENNYKLPDESHRIYGSFNLGSAVSLRLTSSNPNMQNIPSGSTFAKIIKACIVSPPGWIFLSSDYDSLEDKINTLQTRDPNKLKVYTDGFCGHCLRAYSYFKNQMPKITEAITEIDSTSTKKLAKVINQIEHSYTKLRQASKAPTFALTYLGTHITIMNNCGFTKEEAIAIETNYHNLYEVSVTWSETQINLARKVGYVPLAFGGRLRTPMLKQAKGKLSYKAEKEARTANNALGQSYCILTIRALNEFMERVWASEYRYEVLPTITIHDANYILTKVTLPHVKWVNDNLIESMDWNELPELQHDTIKLSSAMDIHYPDWTHAINIPNGASEDVIESKVMGYLKEVAA